MSDTKSLAALNKTKDSITQIRKHLQPYLELVHRYHQQQHDSGSISHTTRNEQQKIEQYQITEAETAIALSIGTLRFMAERLKGKKDKVVNCSSNSPNKNGNNSEALRMELDRIRKTLMELRKLKKKITKSSLTESASLEKNRKKKKMI